MALALPSQHQMVILCALMIWKPFWRASDAYSFHNRIHHWIFCGVDPCGGSPVAQSHFKMITLTLTPAEHAFLLLKLGRGTGSTIRPGESLSAEEVLRLTEKVEGRAFGSGG